MLVLSYISSHLTINICHYTKFRFLRAANVHGIAAQSFYDHAFVRSFKRSVAGTTTKRNADAAGRKRRTSLYRRKV